MTPDDFEAFSELVSATSDVLDRKPLSGTALQVWWAALSMYDFAAVRRAFSVHMRDPDRGQFMPKPADIIRAIGGTTQDAALRAWAMVDKAVRQVGTYQSVVFEDAYIHRAIADMGGWIALGQKKEDEWPFVAREFENRYRGYAARRESPEYQRVLIGVYEAANATNGQPIAPPRLIGNPERCNAVLAGGSSAPMLTVTKAEALA